MTFIYYTDNAATRAVEDKGNLVQFDTGYGKLRQFCRKYYIDHEEHPKPTIAMKQKHPGRF